MSSRRNSCVEHATDLEEQQIWAEYERIYLRETTSTDSDIHLFEDCQAFPNGNYDPQEKSITVYPRGFKSVCRNCLFRWRDGE
jgi:hypothetical protein